MQVLTDTAFFQNTYDPNTGVFTSHVKPESANMDDATYRQEIETLVARLKEVSPKLVRGNMREMLFTIEPRTQAWVNKVLLGCYEELGIKKLALVLSEDFFSSVSIEQTMEERENRLYETRFFTDPEEAMVWLTA